MLTHRCDEEVYNELYMHEPYVVEKSKKPYLQSTIPVMSMHLS